MSYRIYKFGSTTLPSTRIAGTFGTGADIGSVLPTVGGAHDTFGTLDTRIRTPYDVVYSCWIRDTEENTQTALKAWQALRGTRAKLYRLNEYDSTEHWSYARLMQVRAPWQYQRKTMQPLDLQFQLLTPWYEDATEGTPWYLDAGEYLDDGLYLDESGALTYTLSEGSGVANELDILNAGNAQTHYISVSITAGTDAITAVDITMPYTRVTWSGTVASGNALVIDGRSRTVTNDGTDAYSGFALHSSHASDHWFCLLADCWSPMVVTLTGGSTDSELTLTYAHGWN